MAGPLTGMRVVEVGLWVAGPSAAGILADWGAQVVKIEPPDGDPFRALFAGVMGADFPLNPPFELDNRGKRSIQLKLGTPEGRAIAHQLVDAADVFVSNARPDALARAGLDWDSVSKRNPRLVYAHVSGYGLAGPDRDRPAYDIGAFWSRAGIAAALTSPGGDPPYQRGALGDHMAGMTAAGGIAAALFAREKTGRGQLVSTSLLRVGIFALGWDTNTSLRLGVPVTPMTRTRTPNPVICCYPTKDDRWLWLLGLQGDRHWPDLVRAVDIPALLTDPRFNSMKKRNDNCAALVAELDVIFRTRTLHEWGPVLDAAGMWWAPVQTTLEVVQDPQAHAAGAFVDVPLPEGGTVKMVATPVDFSDTTWAPAGPSPELGQHTEEVLLELGYDWEQIGAMREKGVLP